MTEAPDVTPKVTTQSTFKPSFGGAFGGASKKSGAGGYTVGMKVRHPKFGVGTVIAIKNGGQPLNIAFDGQGIKELSAAIAPLIKL
ncbi:MAG: hypothetical protein K2O67_03975 [Clostridia bacterium]|nr:hypothetical protein [Clostridia bacterium]